MLTDSGPMYPAIARFFPGMLPETVADKYPLYPLDAPGMPQPGPDFTTMASHMGDKIPDGSWPKPKIVEYWIEKLGVSEDDEDNGVKALRKKTKDELLKAIRTLVLPFSYLETLHRAALYSPRFSLRIECENERVAAPFLSGHLLGDTKQYGPTRANGMLIGKHPGEHDMGQGRNFVGPYSQDLHEAFKDLGLSSSLCGGWYLTNVVKHQNLSESKDSLPVGWIRGGLALLHQELRLVRPKIVLCMGADATKALLGRGMKMADTIGRIFDMEIPVHKAEDEKPEFHKFKIVCCDHPARIAREPERYDKPEFLGAIRLFAELVVGSRLSIEEKDLERHYLTTVEELSTRVDKVIEETKDGGTIALDAEWHGEYPWEKGAYLRTIQFSHKPKCADVVVLNGPGGKPVLPIAVVVEWINRLLHPKIRIVGHNLKADMVWLRHIGIDLLRRYRPPKNDPPSAGDAQVLGYEKTIAEGGFDTMLAAHAVCETGPFKLEILASQHLGTPRYDAPLMKWRDEYCKAKEIKQDNLEGYGDVPEEILHPYGAYDADVTRRLFDVYNGTPDKPGLLDCDRFGNCCREAFWISQRANEAAFEVETVGIPVDKDEVKRLTTVFAVAKSGLLAKLRRELLWPDFNPESPIQRKEMLFGERYGKRDKVGRPVRTRPPGAVSLKLMPLATTKGRPWSQSGPNDQPSTDKTTICALAPKNPIVQTYRDERFVGQTLKTVLRPPEAAPPDAGDDWEPEYEKGLMSFVGPDGRVRTHIFPVETGRWSSSRPNLMNYSSKRDADYKRILGKDVFRPLRFVFMAPPGCVLIEADYTGAELAVAAWLSQDPKMMEHVRRMQLPEDHPDFYDIHSNIAVASFGLNCPATKKGLTDAGKGHLRIAAKRRIFGYMYGQGDAAALMQIHEEGALNVTLEDVQRTTNGIRTMYTKLDDFFGNCKKRPYDPGYICSPFGRYRRAYYSRDKKRMVDQEREFMNTDIQGTVADAMSTAMGNFVDWRDENPKTKFDIALQIHDAVLIVAPIENATVILEEAIPECMTNRVPIWPCDLDGQTITQKPERLSTDRKVGLRWGQALTKEQAKEFGIPSKYAKD